MANPLQAAVVSCAAFSIGALIPLLAGGFLVDYRQRVIAVCVASSIALAGFGTTGAVLGGANLWVGALRVVIGGWLAMACTYGIGVAFQV